MALMCWVSRLSLVLLLLSACGRSVSARSAESAAAPPVEAPGAMAADAPAAVPTLDYSVAAAAPEAGAGDPEAPAPSARAGGSVGAVVQARAPEGAVAEPARMLDIEAHIALQVADVQHASAELRRLTLGSGGEVVEESLRDATSAARGQLTLRVPSQAAHDLLQKIEGVGTVTSRQVTARDVGKQYYDASLRLENLSWSLARFEQILARASSVDEILRVEAEIARVRGQIEQIKGELRYLRDRTSRATIHISLLGPETVAPPPIVKPEAKFYPGLRLTMISDFWRETGNQRYAGGGVSLRVSRHLSLDIEGVRRASGGGSGLDLFLATLGGELYSDFLGAGRRRWLNPYLGFRAGYARLLGRNEVAAGGTLGLEIFKADFFTLELDARFYGMFGTSAGAHLAVQPALGANVAF